MDKFIVIITGLIGVIFTYWFFFGKKEEAVEAKDEIDITVDGGYNPSNIALKQNQATTLNFIRKDQNSCLEEVILPEFKIKKYLPLNEKVSVVITPKSTGTFPFSCGMSMFHGKIIVK
ncbi:cupredoxin domain-containing protein [Candidatus Gottesmanbacteria bacterium]|nr:cupredoxin domain-containing protein [Candidatus Gottesmanbacteria bacterium]